MIDKEHLRATMMALAEADLAQAKRKYAQFLEAARLDRTEPIEADEQAQAETAADLAEAFDDNTHDNEAKLRALRQIDFGPKSEVEEGAAVDLGDRYLVVAVSTGAFECAGRNFIGISTAAPIYAALEGKKAGDTCEFNGRKLLVRDVK